MAYVVASCGTSELMLMYWYGAVPGPPSSVYFPEVTESSARIAWSEPHEPNGVITGYRVAYGRRSSLAVPTFDDSISASRRDYRVTGLVSYEYYVFTVAAKTQSGWGAEESLIVYTISDRSEFACYLRFNSFLQILYVIRFPLSLLLKKIFRG